MSQAHSSASGDRPTVSARSVCPYPKCRAETYYSVSQEKKTYRFQCETCKQPCFLDWCSECSRWNTVAARTDERHKCGTPTCTMFLQVSRQQCPLCREDTVLLATSDLANQFFCFSCRRRGEIGGRNQPVVPELDMNNVLPTADAVLDKKKESLRSGDVPTQKTAGIQRSTSVPPVVATKPPTGKPAAGPAAGTTAGMRTESAGPAGDLEGKLNALISSFNEFKGSLETDPISRASLLNRLAQWERVVPGSELKPNQQWINGDSELAAAFRMVKKLILGPEDQAKKDSDGQPMKDDHGKPIMLRRWSNMPAAIKKIVDESLKKMSEDDDGPPLKGKASKSRSPGNANQRQAAKGAAEPPGQANDLTTALKTVRKLNVEVLMRLPDLFDALEGCLEDEASQHATGTTAGGDDGAQIVNAVKARVEGQLKSWMDVNGVIKEVPDRSEPYDAQKHELGEDTPTNNPEQNGLIHSVTEAGYVFNDGETQFVLRKPRVVVWYLD